MAWPGFILSGEDGGIWPSLCTHAPNTRCWATWVDSKTHLGTPATWLWLLSTEPGLTNAESQQSSVAWIEQFTELYHL